MRVKTDLRPYQRDDADHIVGNSSSMIWSDVGLGKTATALTAIEELMDRCLVHGCLVLAPLSVVRAVWRQEAKEWGHTQDMTFSLVHGTPKQREAAVNAEAQVYLMNYENLPWLIKYLNKRKQGVPFNMAVYDEVTKMKNSTSARSKAMKKLLPFLDYRVGLTGTPASNGYLDLFGQYLCVDGGERLGTTKTGYRDTYFIGDYMGFNFSLRTGASQLIQSKIKDITKERKKEDYLDLPPVLYQDMWLDLDDKDRAGYAELEREFFIQLDAGGEVEAFNAASLSGKCRQYANGACYVGEDRKEWGFVHDEKIKALKDLYETSTSPLLVAYNFRHDLERLKKAFPNAVSVKDAPIEEIVERWNRGEIDMLLGHPASMGHGLNLQYGGHTLIMFGLPWDLEHYLQVIGRLDRPGQKNPVVVIRLMMEDTIERAVALALDDKAETQSSLRDAIKNYREKR